MRKYGEYARSYAETAYIFKIRTNPSRKFVRQSFGLWKSMLEKARMAYESIQSLRTQNYAQTSIKNKLQLHDDASAASLPHTYLQPQLIITIINNSSTHLRAAVETAAQ